LTYLSYPRKTACFAGLLKTKKAFQGLVLPERLFELFDDLVRPLGGRLLSNGYHHDHGVLGQDGSQGGAHKLRRHSVTGQMLMRVFPKSNH
jgi:hypothetical protein